MALTDLQVAAALGALADKTAIIFVYHVTAFLPAIELLTIFLPNIEGPRGRKPVVEPVVGKG